MELNLHNTRYTSKDLRAFSVDWVKSVPTAYARAITRAWTGQLDG